MPQDKREAVREAVGSLVRALATLNYQPFDAYPEGDFPDYVPVATAVDDLLQAMGHPQQRESATWLWNELRWEGPFWERLVETADDNLPTEARKLLEQELRDAYQHQIDDLEHKLKCWRGRAEKAESSQPRKNPLAR